ncbi:Ldh family oxidoreductase [Pacificimonas flava]|uniref:Ureidoglycolate/malate/sulfolactate dehydrogenase family n=1 Tax=Pacificimonas flava TaxID=1234595 RepID=M2SAY8_9SPHN|nr:Ldh family oxidoreductase [Pacificimonas flava]EMD82555.1 Ureidoglycolate/malate/sulfolactate dehydrogenase family [Pacificimonas flava]MBB5281383.1 LDH2 family malate/lactate/ureidoglycolate dehydrogenase [Pacificimonas flava]
MNDEPERISLSLTDVRALAVRVLEANGLGPAHVDFVADTILAGERDGCAAHGIYRLTNCVKTLRAGKVNPNAVPKELSAASAVTRIDADGGFAQAAFAAGLPRLVERTRSYGIGILAINRCVHFAALWPEIEAVVEQGLVAFACTPSHAWVAPAGGNAPLFGTNPIAFGWPRPGEHPFVFDFATSAAARGEIELHARAGKPIPEGWAIDEDGCSTTDAAAGLSGSLLTFGGHKGSALSALVELLAGPLIGDMTSAESLSYDDGAKASPFGGEIIIAIDPEGVLGEAAAAHIARAEGLFEAILAQGARLPSERRYASRRRSAVEGVTVPKQLYDEIVSYA